MASQAASAIARRALCCVHGRLSLSTIDLADLVISDMKAPVGGLLYSLIHLGGFSGDLGFYATHTERLRVVEFGCGDGRIAAHLCLGEAARSVLQEQQLEQPPPLQYEKLQDEGEEETPAPALPDNPPTRYLGIELCEPLAVKARQRLEAAPNADVVQADFLQPLPEGAEGAFDAAIISANTLYATADHAKLLARCASALAPDGVLLLDVYNALFYHEDEVFEDEDAAAAAAKEKEEEEAAAAADASLLVEVEDEEGVSWRVFERDPDVDTEQQSITCHYEFQRSISSRDADTIDGNLMELVVEEIKEDLVHHYLLPEDLVRLLHSSGFEIQQLSGDFDGSTFYPDESDHLVVVAKRAPGDK